MQRHPILPLGGPEPSKPRMTTAEALQALAALAQVIIALVAYAQLNTPRAGWILALGGALLVLTFGGTLARRLRARWHRRLDDRVARRTVPELRSLVRTLEKLVDPNANDTLQAGLRAALQNYANAFDLLRMPSGHMFDEMLRNLSARVDEEPADAPHVLRALAELYTTVSGHSEQWIQPVFRSMPKSVNELLTPTARGVVNSYRERYLAFLTAFTRFVEDLGGSLRGTRLHSTYFVFRPDALTA